MTHADDIARLKEKLRNADSIADDCPELSEYFHKARTKSKPYTGRYVAGLVLDDDEWKCRSIDYIESGTHIHGNKNDVTLHCQPYPFMETETFIGLIGGQLARAEERARLSQSENDRQGDY